MKFTYRSPGSGNNNNRVRIHLCCSAALFYPAGSSYVWWAGSLFICRLFLGASYSRCLIHFVRVRKHHRNLSWFYFCVAPSYGVDGSQKVQQTVVYVL